MQKLSRGSSGQRHLRWAREILATIKAHSDHNYLLSDAQKQALAQEISFLETRISTLATRAAPYREFLETAHVDVRARQRVGDFLCDEAQREADGRLRARKREIDNLLPGGFSAIWARNPLSRVLRAGRQATVEFAERAASMLRTIPPSITASATEMADGLDRAAALLRTFNAQADDMEGRRLPLRANLQKSVFDVREMLDQMDGRLRTHFSAAFIDSLYPELARKNTVVSDEPDEEDDTVDQPEPPVHG